VSGLGYYSRARRNLHRCAQVVAAEHARVLPARQRGALPPCRASAVRPPPAIAAFCDGERVAILDGNVKRVLTRVLASARTLAQSRHEPNCGDARKRCFPPPDVEDYTQGLMDLGASLCSTRRPDCAACPLAGPCVARAQGRQAAYPVKSRRLQRQQRRNVLLWLSHGDRVWLVRRPASGVWAGLWSFAEFDDDAALAAVSAGWPGDRSRCADRACAHAPRLAASAAGLALAGSPVDARSAAPGGGPSGGQWACAGAGAVARSARAGAPMARTAGARLD